MGSFTMPVDIEQPNRTSLKPANKLRLLPIIMWLFGFACGIAVTSFYYSDLSSSQVSPLSPFLSDDRVGFGLTDEFPPPAALSNTTIERNDTQTLGGNNGFTYEDNELVRKLYDTWGELLNSTMDEGTQQKQRDKVPRAPHLENCRENVEMNKILDTRSSDGSLPPWALWRGAFNSEAKKEETRAWWDDANPPWVDGSDEDNMPLTRRVQKDLWIRQHPKNCSDPSLKFLYADWESGTGQGLGAQLHQMAGNMAIALNEDRILVMGYYQRANHSGCKGSARASWTCYFFSETTEECRNRVTELMKDPEAWAKGTVISRMSNYTFVDMWYFQTPSNWGEPWHHIQPTAEEAGELVLDHPHMDKKWWRAQAIKYLMRFQSEYLCDLVNKARHEAFGMQAAKLVVDNLAEGPPQDGTNGSLHDIERLVWSYYKPWVPRPLLSLHVRMGDKGSEMTIYGFDKHMELANRVRNYFPDVKNIWLSTEMQEVINQTSLYPNWNFYYSKVPRQGPNEPMVAFEMKIGWEISQGTALVNFVMAVEADFAIGSLGSNWCMQINNLRNTGGKMKAGYLSLTEGKYV